MTRHATRKSCERDYQAAHPGMTLTEAKRHVAHAKATGLAVPGVQLCELGGAALPPDATPAQRARAEAIWRPAEPVEPCRCTGSCDHGKPCRITTGCVGRMVHVERYACDLINVTAWRDEYGCATCNRRVPADTNLADVPWGEPTDGGEIRLFDGVRHPAFLDEDDDEGVEYGCDECGARPGYTCTCGGEPEPYCQECGADNEYLCDC